MEAQNTMTVKKKYVKDVDLQTSNLKLVEVEWIDACDGTTEDTDLEKINPASLLVIRKTYGKLLKEDEYAIIIGKTLDNVDIEFTAIPKCCISNIKKFNIK